MSLSHILLKDFRNYRYREFYMSSDFVIVEGPNGSGKTNLLEAISLLDSKRGMRGNLLEKMVNDQTQHDWVVFARLASKDRLSIHFEHKKKHMRINGKHGPNNLVKVYWVCPQNDRLFADSPDKRRQFFEHIFSQIFPQYKRLKDKYNHFVNERSHILKRVDDKWCAIVEDKIARLGAEILTLQMDGISHLNGALRHLQYISIEHVFLEGAAKDAFEACADDAAFIDIYKQELIKARDKDKIIGGCGWGIHKSDFSGFFHKRLLSQCSNGQQCLAMIALFLALIHFFKNDDKSTVFLIDEVVTHLDERNRMILFQELDYLAKQTSLQTWISVCDRMSIPCDVCYDRITLP